MKTSLYAGKYAGIKVFLHWTFLMLLIWITVADAKKGMDNALWSLLYMLGVFACVTLHEFGHANVFSVGVK
jgi:Zn-dependent protease